MLNTKEFLSSDYLSEIQLIDQSDLSLRNKYIRLKRILERCCKEITEGDSLQFPSLFSRIVFIAQKCNLPKSLEWHLQNIRIKSTFLLRSEKNLVSPHQYQQAKEIIEKFLLYISGEDDFVLSEDVDKDEAKSNFYEKLRVQIVDIQEGANLLICRSESVADEKIKVRYNVPTINNQFNETVSRVWVGAQLNLIDVKVSTDGYYTPPIIVLEPDYMIDASAIAECFQSYGSSYLHYFRRKFEPNINSKHILLGNLANFFLDELIYTDDIESITFHDAFLKSFRAMPFEYASCADIAESVDFREFMAKAQSQFRNIKRVVQEDMPENGFDITACMLEPSFFCEKYGFQGRLDLLQLGDKDNRIIELKSGKTPFPQDDVSKIALNHETQTAVYRLMIQTVFGTPARHIYPYILYSSADNKGENLRFAATYKQLEKDIINTRNLIVAAEHDLYTGDVQSVERMFEELFDSDNYGRVPQFFLDKLDSLKKVLDSSSELERAYFYRYVSFISRELFLQKTGDGNIDSYMSVSALWNTSFQERKEALELIENLEIREIDDRGRGMIVYFNRKDGSDCVNFREGEICIVYPRLNEDDSALTNQILKGTVVSVSSEQVIVRFRYKQRNRAFFSQYKYWTIEHDKLDHSYNAMLKNLYQFLTVPVEKKRMLLGLEKPVSSYDEIEAGYLTKEQKEDRVIEKAIAAEDYFMIVGPPGTGKTSVFAKRLIEHIYSDGSANILVIAYTNRAVDELCAAICSAFGEDEDVCEKYVRIGSELSCGETFRHRLLQNLSEGTENRRALLDIIGNTRIFVGTLASIIGKPELLDLKKFNVAIIDEASQILEPQIIGLLPRFDKFIMIGDHKQLSTITLQNEDKSRIKEELLNSIELYDCRESLFERMYRICQKRGWSHAFETLTYHGRMHKDIANLVNEPFYEKQLIEATDRQSDKLTFDNFDKEDSLQSMFASVRVGFLSVRYADYSNVSDKVNNAEADLVVSLSKALLDIYRLNGRIFDPQKTLGIITPYRNQIALIKHKLEETGIPELGKIMIDTVERYQGSQRDVIIISFCFNHPYQLYSFSNMDRENTVDRKLNVALSRAREQLFMVGNDYILRQHPVYGNMLDRVFMTNKKAD